MALTKTQVSELYVAIFNRASEGTGNTYWQGEGSAAEVAQKMLDTVDAKEYFGTAIDDDKAFIEHIYINTLGKTYAEDAEGIDFWVARLAGGESRGEVVAALVVAATDPQYAGTAAQKQFLNRVEVSNYAADTVKDAPANYKQSLGFDGDLTVTDDAATVGAAKGNVDKLAGDKPGVNGKTIELTHKADNLVGTDGDDVFVAPVKQNETGSGALANTLETGDILDGGAGRDTLKADLIASGTISGQNPVISAQTSNIEEVYLRAQNIMGLDQGTNTTARATIDAERMVGVEQWWTENSRADVRIEDVRERPNDVTLGMRLTDPQVNFEVYFNPLFMDGGQLTESNLIIQIAELNGGAVDTAAELKNISVTELAFELDGKSVALATADMAAANTWAELETALKSALEDAGLGDLQVTRGNDGQFMLFDAKGRVFSEQGGFTAKATTNQQIDIRNRITQDLDVQDQQTEVDIILDGVGNGSLGGNLNVAAMSGSRGVEVFHVEVDRTSHLATMRSDNNPLNNGAFSTEQQLEEVYISHLAGGAKGNLSIGHRTVDANGVSQTTDDRLHDGAGAVPHAGFAPAAAPAGLSDVRVFDASGFTGALKVGAELTANAIDKYLLNATETVQFSYLLGDGGSNLSLSVDNALAADIDFALEIVGGAGDDRINLSGLANKNSTTIDGGNGVNTVEVNTDTGTTVGNTWAGFDNIQKLVVAGNFANTQNIVNGKMTGLDEIVVATGPAAVTTLQRMSTDQALTISGKNQTLGAGNNNNNQAIAGVNVNGTSAGASDKFTVALDNTARADGVLTVGALSFGDTAAALSAVRTVELESNGRRDTANVVGNFTAARATTLELTGTQDLDITVNDLASLPAVGGVTPAATITGAELEGNLNLRVQGAVLDNDNLDSLVGTQGSTDLLELHGAMNTNARINGFETVAFNNAASGLFDAVNTTDVNNYRVLDLGAPLVMDNLANQVSVELNDGDGARNVDFNLTLNAGSIGTDNTIDVDFAAGTLATVYNSALAVNEYRTINVDFGATAAADSFALNLVLDGRDDSTVPTVTEDAAMNYARTLNVTGGNSSAVAVDDLSFTSALSGSLTKIDFSGFAGRVNTVVAGESLAIATDVNGVPLAPTNTTIVLNAYQFDWDNGTLRTAGDVINTFVFTQSAYYDATLSAFDVWSIDNFMARGVAAASGSNLDVLDLRQLGIKGFSDLTITDIGGGTDAQITSNLDGVDFEIYLTGVDVADLWVDNFQFAV